MNYLKEKKNLPTHKSRFPHFLTQKTVLTKNAQNKRKNAFFLKYSGTSFPHLIMQLGTSTFKICSKSMQSHYMNIPVQYSTSSSVDCTDQGSTAGIFTFTI